MVCPSMGNALVEDGLVPGSFVDGSFVTGLLSPGCCLLPIIDVRNIRSPGCPVCPRNTAIRHWRPLSRGLAENRKTVIQSRERTCVIRLRSVDAVDFNDFILG